MKLRILRAVECPYRENLSSIYRCTSCVFQSGSIESGLACGRDEIDPTVLVIDNRHRVYCPIRRRDVKTENCVACFYKEALAPDHVKCMAGKVYIRRRES